MEIIWKVEERGIKRFNVTREWIAWAMSQIEATFKKKWNNRDKQDMCEEL